MFDFGILQKIFHLVKFFLKNSKSLIEIGFQLILYDIKMCSMVQSQLFENEIIARWKTSLKHCWWPFQQEISPYDIIRSWPTGLHHRDDTIAWKYRSSSYKKWVSCQRGLVYNKWYEHFPFVRTYALVHAKIIIVRYLFRCQKSLFYMDNRLTELRT